MQSKQIRWGAAVGGALVAEIGQIVASVVWVAIYSYMINPGQPMAVYEQHAQKSGPWVSIFAGFLIFYLASRWIARSVPTALALFAVLVVIDGALLLAMANEFSAMLVIVVTISYGSKALACYLGGRHAESRRTAATA